MGRRQQNVKSGGGCGGGGGWILRFLAEWNSKEKIVFPCLGRSEFVKPNHFQTE